MRSSWSANVRSIMYSGMAQIVAAVPPACLSTQAVTVGVGGGLGAIRAAGLAQDAADVVGGGVLADDSVVPISRLLRPRAISARICTSRGDRPSGGPRRRGGPSARIRPSSSACRSARRAPPPRPAAPRPIAVVAAAREQEAPVLVGGVGEPGRRAHPPVELHRALEVRRGPVGLAQRRGKHAQVPVGGAVAGDQVADHHVRAAPAARARGRRARPISSSPSAEQASVR